MPKTLFFTASPGFHSIIGTCLCAAAWKTTSGAGRRRSRRTRGGRVMSAMHGTMRSASSGKLAISSRWMWKRVFSACSTRTSIAGSKRQICRQISEPMLPPAPVTRTTRFRMTAEIAVHLEHHRLAAEEVLDADVADAREVHLSADDLVDAGDDLRGEPRRVAELLDAADLRRPARWRW